MSKDPHPRLPPGGDAGPFCPSCVTMPLTPLRKGGYLCEECDRRWDEASVAPRPARAKARIALEEESLPFAIAHPFAHAKDANRSPEERLEALVFTAYQMVRVSSVLLLSDYLAANAPSRKIHLAIRAMRSPDWWSWTVLSNQLCRYFLGELDVEPPRSSHFPLLSTGWRSVNRKLASKKDSRWASLLEALPGRSGPAESANDALWAAREELEARSRIDGADVNEASLVPLVRVVEASLAKLFPAGSFELVRRVDTRGEVVRLVRLHGAHDEGRFALELRDSEMSAALGESGIAAFTETGIVPIVPVLLALDGESRRHPMGGGGFLEPLRVRRKDDETFARIESLGGAGRPVQVFGPALASFRANDMDLLVSSPTIAVGVVLPWATARVASMLDALRGRSYFPEAYVERAGFDDVLETALAATGKAIVLLGEPGSGKTSLLLRLAARAARLSGERDANRSPDLVLLASGRAAFVGPPGMSADTILVRAIAKQMGASPDAYPTLGELLAAMEEESWRREGRRCWVLLDGIDQAERGEELLAALERALPRVLALPWVRVVVTVRTATYASRGASVDGSALGDARLFARFQDSRAGVSVPYLEARPFDEATLEQAYAKRQLIDPTRASDVPPSDLPEAVRALLTLPLCLHLFHEARWSPSGVLAIRGEQDLARAHLDVLAERGRDLLPVMADLGDALLRHRGSGVPAQEGPVSRGLGTHEPLIDLSRLEDIGLVVPPVDDSLEPGEKIPCTFAHPSLADELLIGALLRRIAPRATPTGEDLASWGGLVSGPRDGVVSTFPELARALGVLARRMLVAGDVNQVMWLLTIPDEETATGVLGEALRQLGPSWGGARVPSEVAQRVLDALETVSADPGLAKLVARAVRPVERWLRVSGLHAAAIAMEQVHLRATHSQIAAQPNQPDLQRELARSLAELARLAMAEGHVAEARQHLEKALKARHVVVELLPGDPEAVRELARSLFDLATCQEPGERAPDAKKHLGEARRRAQIVDDDSEESTELFADLEDELGSRARAEDRLDEATAHRAEALAHRRRLGPGTPTRDDRLIRLGATLRHLGELELLAGDAAGGRRHLEEATGLLRGVTAREPLAIDGHRELFRALSALGSHARAEARREDARRLYDEALEGGEWLAEHASQSSGVLVELSRVLDDAGMLAMLGGKRGRARSLLERAVTIARNVLVRTPNEHFARRALVIALTNLGNAARAEGKQTEAKKHFAEGAEATSALFTTPPAHVDDVLAAADLFWSASLVDGDPHARREAIDRARALLDPLRPQMAQHPKLARLWQLASKSLGT